MKFVQQLLVAPSALGLLPTGANATELNINGVAAPYSKVQNGQDLIV